MPSMTAIVNTASDKLIRWHYLGYSALAFARMTAATDRDDRPVSGQGPRVLKRSLAAIRLGAGGTRACGVTASVGIKNSVFGTKRRMISRRTVTSTRRRIGPTIKPAGTRSRRANWSATDSQCPGSSSPKTRHDDNRQDLHCALRRNYEEEVPHHATNSSEIRRWPSPACKGSNGEQDAVAPGKQKLAWITNRTRSLAEIHGGLDGRVGACFAVCKRRLRSDYPRDTCLRPRLVDATALELRFADVAGQPN